MRRKSHSSMLRPGMSLIETMGSAAVMLIIVLGAGAYSYHACLDARRANMRTYSTRIAGLFCESWRGVGGADTFDPIAYFGSDLDITAPLHWDGSQYVPSGFTLLGTYRVRSQGIPYGVVLSWRDVNSGLRALNVVLCWPIGEPGEREQQKLVKLTTYAPI